MRVGDEGNDARCKRAIDSEGRPATLRAANSAAKQRKAASTHRPVCGRCSYDSQMGRLDRMAAKRMLFSILCS